MRTNLKQQLINRLNSTNEPFIVTLRHKKFPELKESLTFRKGSSSWYVVNSLGLNQMNVGTYNRSSVHLYSYIAGCKHLCIIQLEQILTIQPLTEAEQSQTSLF
ncbi:hypothetical protein Slin_0695 [Spirosoma linguale DSM 74]|uniref:Uncharacterized protein n=1 Tax=Spirosoma linguale (strain ATCC 33905 / DSM 74 / LMG 10896 / Claus 1) TaxID=504472 RepID=D2QGZ2_SPILD|nr:hypothetical protein Slin_0695 [Spirosoma linguale DSM 74]